MRTNIVLCVTMIFLMAAATYAQKPVRFTSAYTRLDGGCKTLRGSGGTDDAFLCKGIGGYKVRVYFSAATMQINAERGEENSPLATLDVGFDQSRMTVEWRLANGKPFAVIMRVPIYADPKPGEYFGPVVGQQLKVIGLGPLEINETVDAATANANRKARNAADKAYRP